MASSFTFLEPRRVAPRFPGHWVLGFIILLVGNAALTAQARSTADRITSMRADLRNLMVSQEAHFAEYSTYAKRTGSNADAGVALLSLSPGNVLVLSNVTQEGWTGTITYRGLPPAEVTCGVFIGPPRNAPNAATTQEGSPACWGTGVEGSGRIVPQPPVSTAAALLDEMRANLRTLVIAQEVHFAAYATYAPAFGREPGKGRAAFTPASGSTVVLSNVSDLGYTAVITNSALTGPFKRCGVFIGPGRNSPNASVTTEGTPDCW